MGVIVAGSGQLTSAGLGRVDHVGPLGRLRDSRPRSLRHGHGHRQQRSDDNNAYLYHDSPPSPYSRTLSRFYGAGMRTDHDKRAPGDPEGYPGPVLPIGNGYAGAPFEYPDKDIGLEEIHAAVSRPRSGHGEVRTLENLEHVFELRLVLARQAHINLPLTRICQFLNHYAGSSIYHAFRGKETDVLVQPEDQEHGDEAGSPHRRRGQRPPRGSPQYRVLCDRVREAARFRYERRAGTYLHGPRVPDRKSVV